MKMNKMVSPGLVPNMWSMWQKKLKRFLLLLSFWKIFVVPIPVRPSRCAPTSLRTTKSLAPPETEADKRVKTLKAEISQRFKKHLAKERNKEQSSASESEAPKRVIKSKPMPKKQKDAASAASSDRGTYDTATGINTQVGSPYGGLRTGC